MGLLVVTGTMGGGKSYAMAKLALMTWKRGGYVHSNVPWEWSQIPPEYKALHVDLPPDAATWVTTEIAPDGTERKKSDVIIGGTEASPNVIIVDEAALILHSMDQADNKRRNRTLFETVVMSRQLGVDMYFVTQAAENIDSSIRKVAEFFMHCANLGKVPGYGWLLKMIYGDFIVKFLSPGKKIELRREVYRYEEAVGKIYNTTGVGDTFNIQRKGGNKKRMNLSVQAMAFIAALVVLTAITIYWTFGKNGMIETFYETPEQLHKRMYGEAKETTEVGKKITPAGEPAKGGFPGQFSTEKPEALTAVIPQTGTYITNRNRIFSMMGAQGIHITGARNEGTKTILTDSEGNDIILTR